MIEQVEQTVVNGLFLNLVVIVQYQDHRARAAGQFVDEECGKCVRRQWLRRIKEFDCSLGFLAEGGGEGRDEMDPESP